MDMLTVIGVPLACFVAFFLSAIVMVEVVIVPLARAKYFKRIQQFLNKFMIAWNDPNPRRYPASGRGD